MVDREVLGAMADAASAKRPRSPSPGQDSKRWHNGTADAYDEHHILDYPEIWDGIAKIILPYSKGKKIADLGCADGKLSTRLQAASCANVDPFPPSNPPREIIKMDGVEYLKTCEPESLDLVIALGAVHLMDRVQLDNELARVLVKGGHFLCLSVSPSTTFFGNKAFNESFFSVGFEKSGADGHTVPKTHVVERPITYKQAHDWITNRTWSNMVIMPQSQIDFLASEIPKDISRICVSIDVYEFTFTADRWHTGTADAYDEHHILDYPQIWDGIGKMLLPYTKGKRLADLGCADGKLSTRLEGASCANVDPFPPSKPPREIIKMDGVEYLKTCKAESLDVIIALGAIHFMDREQLFKEMARVVCKGGYFLCLSVSPSTTFFGNKSFNESFFSVGFERSGADGKTVPKTHVVERPITYKQAHDWITNRTWSNMVMMPQSQIDFLASEIPKDITKICVSIDVYEFTF